MQHYIRGPGLTFLLLSLACVSLKQCLFLSCLRSLVWHVWHFGIHLIYAMRYFRSFVGLTILCIGEKHLCQKTLFSNSSVIQYTTSTIIWTKCMPIINVSFHIFGANSQRSLYAYVVSIQQYFCKSSPWCCVKC